MDLYSPKTIKSLLQGKPNKLLGQNFLLEKRAAAKILKAAELSSEDTVLEIGPGIGTLTQELAQKAGRVIAVEKDQAMVEILKTTLKDFDNVQIIQGDILKMSIVKCQLSNVSYKVAANLPYYITSPVMRMFLETERQPELFVLMVQKELAQRIAAKPPDMSILGVSVQFYATAEIVSLVHKGAFWPQPKVDSAILKLTPLHYIHDRKDNAAFFRVVKAGFAQPRKQLLSNLVRGLGQDRLGPALTRERAAKWLQQNGIDPKQRAETLSLQDWINLTKSLP